MARRLDDKEIQIKGQNKIFFQISAAGHEAIGAAAAGAPPGLRLVLPMDSWVAYAARPEGEILPQVDDVKRACKSIVRF